MIFECKNEACENFGTQVTLTRVSYRFRDGKLRAVGTDCPVCSTPMEDVTERPPLDRINVSIARIGSMTPDQKSDVLKKRASQHYETHIKPYKEHLHHTAQEQMTEINKMKKG